ncbi:MAG: peptide/nickel transport system ATP-binding protein [Candidatus Atribacteria bacterium]|uniref:Dipeptide ABC transporter ATP-binding protein n=1 Tax=Thermatribacter velox TaxID=3039681 RepID=A0ABZ2Y9J1_9BACT|nr:peptide/nickel transport system ATP-binding protein [Candidatus Atribacteria bacterium]
MSSLLLKVNNLSKKFFVKSEQFSETLTIDAVNAVSLSINQGEVMALVGESGCGKSTLGRCILRLEEPDTGEVFFKNQNILALPLRELKTYRQKMQIIFQDPFASLNPRKSIRFILEEPLLIHGIKNRKERQEKVLMIAEKVGLSPGDLDRFPHEFSGGQRQRVGIARALILQPDFIVCDEPVSALDVSIQAQILNLLSTLQKEMQLTYLFISHDLSVVKHISNRVAVMYLGKIVEVAPKKELFENPLHPYTRALLASIPIPNPRKRRKKILLQGDPPSPTKPPRGCRFHTRCPEKMPICSEEEPLLWETKPDHQVACHLFPS